MAELNGSMSSNITKEENFQTDEENFLFNEQEFASIFTEETYKNKLKEFEIAICKRDHIIQQLTDKLEECVRGKEKTEEELKIKSEEFAKEFENLELQLKECINPLKKNYAIEYETLKSKLSKRELDLSQTKETNEKLTQELREREEDQNITERKYKMLFQAQQGSQERHLSELKALEETLKMKFNEKIGQLEQELMEFRQENEQLREKIKDENTELRINDLISQLELKSSTIEKLGKENDEIVIENKKSLETLKAELSEKHEKEIEYVKNHHKSQVKLLAEQIDDVKRKQEADQKEIKEALKEAFSEKMKQVRELKEAKDKNAKLLKELEDTRLKTADLESKCSLLDLEVGAEKETSETRLRAVNEALKAKKYLEERIIQLEIDVKNSFEKEKEKARELANVSKELQEEKESKNEVNLKVKELTLKNESLFIELETYSHNYTTAKEKLNIYENEIETLKEKLSSINGEKNLFENSQKESKNEISNLSLQVRNLEIEKKYLSDTLSDLQCKYTSDTSSFEAQISKLSEEKLLLENFLEKYKEGYHSLNEKLLKVCHNRERKEDSFSDTELIRDCSMNAEEADPISLLASRISFLSDQLEETESVASKFNSLLQEKDFYKEEYDKLMTKVKEEENTSLIKNDSSENSASPVHYKECKSCHKTISTQDQGFQTSLDQNLCYLPTTKTIEDYTIEEIEQIYTIPSTASMKCSVSLKDLKEIGAAENKNDLGLSTGGVPADYDQLMAKYHESLLAIKSLKNENALLRQALKFKQSISIENKGESNDYIDEGKENDFSRKISELNNSERDNSKVDSLYGSEKSNLGTEEVQEKQTFEPLEKEERKPISSDSEANTEKNALNSQLQLQINFNETLKEELQMLQLNLTHCKDWEEHLRKGVDLFIKTHHPFLERKGGCILNIVDSWKEILNSERSVGVAEERTKEKEMDTNDLKNLLIALKDLIAEQKESKKILKDMENNIIACMGNNMDALVQSLITKEDSFTLEFDTTTFEKMGNSDLMAAGDGNDILKEFQDITKSIIDATQEEKMKLFQNQRNILNILEENQSRINEIFKKHFNNLIANSSIEDVKSILKTVAENVDSSLNEESVMIEKMYSELLKQYSHEETLHSQSRALTLNEFKSRLSLHLQQNKGQTSGSFSNVDLWKRLISALSQVTSNLLHYYTISQKFANDEADNQLLPESLPAAGGYALHFGPVTSLDDSEEENSLKVDMEGRPITEESVLNILDSTVASEGMLEDFERNEQIKEVLTSSYPNLTKVLKGNYDQVAFPDLEKEAQEFIISLQASTGMLRIFMLSKADNPMSCLPPWKPTKNENNSTAEEEANAQNENRMGENEAQITIGRETHSKHLELSLTDMTPVKRTFVPDLDTQLAVLKSKLNEEQKEKEEMSKKFHHIEGLYAGLAEEKKLLMNEFKIKEDQINDLVRQVQQTAQMLKKAEDDLKGNENLKAKKNWHPKEKNIKEKVKAVLSARDKESLNQRELVERVRDLEVVLEETVTERDALNMKVHDLSQQFDTADRQLRSNKQFFDVQAAERDQEMDELVKVNEKLRNDLKEREALISQHHSLQKEVQMLEKELKENYTSLEEKETEIDEKQNYLSAALHKIRDLKQDIDSLEQQLSTKCSENENLLRRLQNLEEELRETNEKNIRLQHELEILSQKIQFNPSSRQNTNLVSSEDDLNHNKNHFRPSLMKQISLSEEIENSKRDLQCQTSLEEYENTNAPPTETRSELIQENDIAVPDNSLFEDLLDRLEKSTVGLESLQFTMMTGSGASDEELSVREHLQWSESPCIKKTRSLSPSSLEAKLEEKFLAFERSAEAAAKYAKDLEMRYCSLKAEYDEVINERDDLNERLSALSSIKSDLDKASQESELLRQDFDKKVQTLKDQLSLSKSKESELKSEYKSLQSKIILKEEELTSIIIQEREQFKNDADAFKKEKSQLEKTIKEYFEEKEVYRKQNSEQLIKISCLEARLEDLKRSESPHEHELKTKINYLKEDLEKCREELTLKFREVETLRYNVKELKDQLVIREEQLDNLSRRKEYQSLPPSSTNENRELAHALEGLEAQKNVNQQLMEKLQKMKKEMRNSSSLSDGLISLIVNEKDAAIKEVLQERKRLFNLLRDVLQNLQNRRPNREIIKMVKENLKLSEKCPSTSDDLANEEDEIQRGTSVQTINEIDFKTMDRNDEFVCRIADPRLGLSCSDDGKGRLSNHPLDNLELESIHPINDSNEFCNGRGKIQITNHVYGKKLETDFEVAQEMLESKEEELESMAAEVEDCVTMPLQNSDQINEMIFENDNLRKTVEDLQSQLQAQQTSMEKLQEYENASVELRKTLDENSRKNEELVSTKENLEHKISYLESQLEEKQNRIEKLKQDLELRNKEIADLSNQVGQILTQFKDSNTKYKKKINNLEREHFREMQDMKDKNIEREKQLCNEYEDRLSSQVGELTLKLSREKEEALRNYQNHYEELLSKATKQKQNEQKVREEKSKNCSEETQKEMQRKLEMAVGLDESFMSYLENGIILSRESSVTSEGKDGRGSIPDEDRSICSRRLQSLIRKINLEGIQVLTLSEKLFLQSHQEILQESIPTHQHPPILLDKDNEMRVKELENKLKIAIHVREEYRGMVHRVDQDADDLRKRLSEETSDAIQNYNKIYQDLQSSRESVKVCESQISELEAALAEERINFRMISSTLDNERKLAASSNEHQNNIIKDLRNSLEKERNRNLALMNEVHELKMSKYQLDSTTESLSASITEIFNERDRKFMEELEMHRKIDNLQFKLSTANYERNCLKRDLEVNLLQREQLELALKEVESKKRSVDIELQNKNALIKELSTKVKLLENELCEWKESRSRMRKLLQQKQDENEAQFRWSNEDVKRIGRTDYSSSEQVSTFTLKELKKKDIEIEALQQKILSLEKDLKLQKEKLESVNSENLESNNAGLQIKDVGKFLEIQHRENVELCKSVLKLIDEGHVLRQKNLKLEEVVDELKAQLAIRERSLNLKDEHVLIAEKTALAAEVSALKLALKQCETKNENLTKQINTRELNNDAHQLELALKKEGISARYLQWKFNRCESYRRALVWQKSYLIHMLNFYHMKSKKLTNLTQGNLQVTVDYLEKYQQINIELTPLSKFKSAALVIVALSRMKFIMNKWELGRKLEATHNRSPSPVTCPVDSSPLVGIPRRRSPHTLDIISPFHITGLTPPTKDVPPARIKTPAFESRNLFGCRKDEKDDIDEYINRLDYIHTQLGLSSRITKPGTKDT